MMKKKCILLAFMFFQIGFCWSQSSELTVMLKGSKSPDKINITKNIQYNSTYKFDLYQPVRPYDSTLIIIMNGFGDPNQKNADYQIAWAKFLAEDGINAITFESHREDVAGDFDALIQHIQQNATKYSIDPEKIGIIAFSGNVVNSLPIITDAKRTAIKSAIIYYGYGKVTDYRLDLPMFFVRSGLDNINLNKNLDTLLAKGLAHNAPWTIHNHPSGHHPFEFSDPEDVSIQVLKNTLAFVHQTTTKKYRATLADKMLETKAGTALYTNNWKDAILYYDQITKKVPAADNFLKLGNAYYGGGNYMDALHAFDASLAKGEFRLRDLCIPATLAAAKLKNKDLLLKWATLLAKAPGGKYFLKTTAEFSFMHEDASWNDLLK